MDHTDKQARKMLQFGIQGFILFVFVLLVKYFWPTLIPFSVFEFWSFKGDLLDLMSSSWPIFAWGVGVNVIHKIKTKNNPVINRHAEKILSFGLKESLIAGIFEEIVYRWLTFYTAIVGALVTNFLFLGFAGQGIVYWIFTNVAGPIANFATLGYLAPYLLGTLGWSVGAGIISANGEFRNGHSYQGLLGYTNSWFFGMFMFWLMFQYGLIASILVHFLYNMFIDIVAYVDATIERKKGYV